MTGLPNSPLSPQHAHISKGRRRHALPFMWGAILVALLLLLAARNRALDHPLQAIESTLAAPTPTNGPLTFKAKSNIPAFTILKGTEFTISKGVRFRQATNSSSAIDQITKHITLHSLKSGETMAPSQLGPTVSISGTYEVLTIPAVSPLSWLRTGDVVRLIIEPLITSDQSPARLATPAVTPTTNANSATPSAKLWATHTIDRVAILEIGRPSGGGLIPLLVAIPSAGNNLPVVNRLAGHMIGYPAVYAAERLAR